jgi:hypothetical protein
VRDNPQVDSWPQIRSSVQKHGAPLVAAGGPEICESGGDSRWPSASRQAQVSLLGAEGCPELHLGKCRRLWSQLLGRQILLC